MGVIIAKLFDRFPMENEVRLLLLGLNFAGKTTILRKLNVGKVVTATTASGFNVETVRYRSVSLIAWDAGGPNERRSHWRQHFQNTSAIIFVVDSNDRNRIDESRDELAWLMSEDELKDCCVLVMANKQDLPNAMSINGIAERLGLKSFPSSRTWNIQGTSAITGDGLYDGLDWLKDTLTAKAKHS